MIRRSEYEALLVDLDGTLLDDRGRVRPASREALRALDEAGVPVMIATGRSTVASLPVHEELGLRTPMMVFNGAAFHCPREGRLVEERILSNRVLERALTFGRERDHLMVFQLAQEKFATPPRDASEEAALSHFHGLEVVELDKLPSEYVIRVIYYSAAHASSEELCEEVRAALRDPVYLTAFPLELLVQHRGSPLQVVDVHAPSRGKAEGLRFIEERYGVPARRVVAIGDASNDVPMLREAGLGVAMEGSCPLTQAAADRVIGDNNGDAIAELVAELFGLGG